MKAALAVVLGLWVAGLGAFETASGMSPAAAGARPDTTRAGEREKSRRQIKDEMARIGQSEVPGLREWERRKSPRVAMVSSMVLPGLGQLYNGRRIKTMIAVGAFSYYLGVSWLEQKEAQEHLKTRDTLPTNSVAWANEEILYQFHKENAVTYLWWAGAAWLITVLDAFVDAHLYDVRAVTPAVVETAGDTKYIALSFNF